MVLLGKQNKYVGSECFADMFNISKKRFLMMLTKNIIHGSLCFSPNVFAVAS